ncbi:MAG: ubiquinone/menaquinone biosynthesis methyltransferase [Verrucomicrobiae bacterium]|nr:ubiquinone/menaquinone biosynthesis methyltransferase [Verrucomicrobiae bacterium]NNJ42781.1 ubiquinone/menaquinone biosynthesis methyltransferase [Akkermansiaceae bacterium]
MQDPNYVKKAFSRIADRYVVTNHVLSLGTDILWRKKVGRIVAGWNPETILDVATGTGDLALEIQKKCPDTQVTGSDFCEEMLAYAAQSGVRETVVADAMAMPFDDDSFDGLTVAFGLRNMADWSDALQEMYRVIKPKGHLLVLDFSLPTGVLRKPYRFYLNKVLPKIAGVMTGEGDAYEYLAGTIEQFPSGKEMTDLINSCGFTGASARPLTCGVASIYTATA